MAREIINVGAAPNDGQGDPIRTAFTKTNNNFGELYSRIQTVPPVALTGSVGDVAGMTAYNNEYYYYCFANYNGSSVIWRQVPNAAQANITALSATGNVTANYYIGNGSQLTGVIATAGPAIVNGNTNITLANNGNATITINGTSNVAVFTTTGVDISGNVTAGTLSTTGNVSAGNLRTTGAVSATGIVYSAGGLQTAGAASATGNVAGGNVLTGGIVSATGTATLGNVTTGGTISSVGNINTSANVIAVGNVSGAYIIGDGGLLSNVTVVSNVAVTQISNGTSSLAVAGSAGNILVNINGVSNVAQFVPNGIEVLGNVNSANIYLSGRFVSAGNVTGSNLLATSGVIATGNVSGAHVNSDLTMSASGNITGGNLRTAGSVSASGNVTGITFIGNVEAGIVSSTGNVNAANIFLSGRFVSTGNVTGSNLRATSDVIATGNVTGGQVISNSTMSAVGNITGSYFFGNGSQLIGVVANSVGTLAALSVTGNTTTGNLLTGGAVSATGNVIGLYFVGTATSAQYADIAENYTADAAYEPGTVLEFGGGKEVTIAADETTRVAGIVSTQPAHLMNSMLNSEHVVAVALLGRVPCRVRGTVAKGDMLVSAGNGYAQSKQNPMMGTVIGKALEASTGDHSIIEVVVGRL